MEVAKEIQRLEVIHQQRQVGLKPNEICIRDGIILSADEYTRYGFEFFSFRSPQMVYELDWFIDKVKGRRCLLDIGAYRGLLAATFSILNPKGIVHAFEPLKENYEALCLVTQNYNVKNYNIALSDKNETKKFHKEWDNLVLAESNMDCWNETGEVECVTGDDFCLYNNVFPDTIKIDVEGYELNVLNGLRETIISCRPMIFLELHCGRLKKDEFKNILDMIDRWGYKIIDTEDSKEKEISIDETIDKRIILIP